MVFKYSKQKSVDHIIIYDIPIDIEAWSIIRSFATSRDSGKYFLASLLTGLFVVLQYSDPESNDYTKLRSFIDYGKIVAHRAGQENKIDSAALSTLGELTCEIMKRCQRPDNMQEMVNKIMKTDTAQCYKEEDYGL